LPQININQDKGLRKGLSGTPLARVWQEKAETPMPTAVAALTPATQPIQHRTVDEADNAVQEMSFNELWQDKKEGLSFGDFLDIINPLQHLPIVSNIYRMITGDEIGVGPRLAGGALYGGPLGLLGAGVVAAVESISGETVENQIASAWNSLTGDDAPTQLAQAAPAETPVVAAAATVAQQAVAAAQPEAEPAAAPAAPALRPEQIASAAPATAAATAAAHPAFALPPSRIYVRASAGPATAAHAPTSSTAAPAHAAEKPQTRTADADAARLRIQQWIEKAQRAQAGLLLASVAAEPSATTRTEDGDGAEAVTSPAQPFRSHPYMLPPGAPPEMVNKAMAQALNRYEAILKQRQAVATSAAPRPAAAPVH
jgi:hypothetical protein